MLNWKSFLNLGQATQWEIEVLLMLLYLQVIYFIILHLKYIFQWWVSLLKGDRIFIVCDLFGGNFFVWYTYIRRRPGFSHLITEYFTFWYSLIQALWLSGYEGRNRVGSNLSCILTFSVPPSLTLKGRPPNSLNFNTEIFLLGLQQHPYHIKAQTAQMFCIYIFTYFSTLFCVHSSWSYLFWELSILWNSLSSLL